MEMHELMSFINAQTERLNTRYHQEDSQKNMVMITMVKLMEEVGELSSEVLTNYGIARKEKLENHSHENLAKECADVIITALILCRRMNVDIEKTLEEKIAFLHKRFAEQS